ncbi:hypothetical protein F3Y22_tig00110370pilonHSYRG00013 [Hibiscus syriacus]|uniref:Reverse transcriptase domain-containing protein n=1 Tax=Hibiscus syriacus TaxID=106335 RepID=A0A6A3AT87_HIBSY|nr:hypothetical protein F3Y22_tig00110370pilonHSYRG00013 [Hibiscus syriacus]
MNLDRVVSGGGSWVAFVDNLSRRGHRSVLWDRFSLYGKEDLIKAKEKMNNVLVDGRRILVSYAKYQRSSFPRNLKRNSVAEAAGVGVEISKRKNASSQVVEAGKKEMMNKFHDGRTYKDTVVGLKKVEGQQSKNLGDKREEKKPLDFFIPMEERSWLRSSLIGIVKAIFVVEFMQRALRTKGINVKVIRWGYAKNACLTVFQSVEEKEAALEDKWEALSFWFERLESVIEERGVLLPYCAVSMMGVSLNCWSVPFFTSLASRWGKLVKIQEQTAQRVDCRVAQMLLRVESSFDIPPHVIINTYGRSFTIKIKVDSSDDFFPELEAGVGDDGVDEDGFEGGSVDHWEEVSSDGSKCEDRGGLQGQLNFQQLSDSRNRAEEWVRGTSQGGGSMNEGNLKKNTEANDSFNVDLCTEGTTLGEGLSKQTVSGAFYDGMGLYHCPSGVLLGGVRRLVMLKEAFITEFMLGGGMLKVVVVRTMLWEQEMRNRGGQKQWSVGKYQICRVKFKGGEKEFVTKVAPLVKGLGRKVKARAIRRFVEEKKSTILFLQESKLEVVFVVKEKVIQTRFVALKGWMDGIPNICCFINVYGPSVEADKEPFFRELTSFLEQVDCPVCLGGYFNALLTQEEKMGADGSAGGLWNENLFEVRDQHNHSRFMALSGRFKMSNFECVIINFAWGDFNAYLVPEEKCGFTQNWHSMELFRFYNYLLEEDGFAGVVEKSVSNPRKVNGGRGLFSLLRELEARINGLELKIQGGGISSQERELLVCSRKELWNLHRKEERIWLQRSRVKWSIEGTETQFFHLSALNRNRINTISSLKVAEDVISDPKKLRGFVFEYFKDNYNSKSTLQEVWEAVFHSDSAKAPGPDGFTMGFFKKFWSTLKPHITKFVEDFYNGRNREHGVNHAFLTLIPKIRNPESIEDYRPISLVDSLYKIISKILSRRLVSVIKDLVSPSQFAFIPGRQLLDCAFLANEVIDYWRKKGRKGVVFKVDFRRAYDSVEWPILLRLLRTMGFRDGWISWIDLCISSASISVLVNGSPTNEFKLGKGLRQGCNLSHLLFNIVGELLDLMLIKAADCALFEGFSVGREDNLFHLKHLHFADDLILFCRDSSTQILNIRRVLRIFSLMTSLHLNLSKSKLFGVNLDDDVLKEWAQSAGCCVGAFPMTYLGLLIGTTRNSELLWEPVLQKFSSKLAGWKATSLSMAGRLVLVKSVLSSLPIFYLSIFKIPLKINQKLNSLMANFLWGDSPMKKRIHWVNWKMVCQPYEEEGLGVLDLSLTNRALLGKWVWKFANEKDSQWKKMICCKHNIRNGDGLFSVKACKSALTRRSGGIFQWNKWVWTGLAPPKVETFLWQLSHKKLAVRVELQKREVSMEDLLCPLCKKEKETIQHLFILCPVAWELWNRFIMIWDVSTVLPKDPMSLLWSWSVLMDSSSIWKFIPVVVLWSLWKARNLVVFENWNFESSTLFFICIFRLAKWFLAKFPKANIQVDLLVGDPRLADSLAVLSHKRKIDQCWFPPPPDFYKFNVDGAVRGDGLQGGTGNVLKDSNGSILISFSKAMGPGPPLLAELKAIKEGMDLFLNSGWVLKGDLISTKDIVVRLVPRACNWEADKLAKEGIG